MNWATFTDSVKGFVNRTGTDLTQGSTDMILTAANMAKTFAQRKRVFHMARDTAFLAASDLGTAISDAKDAPGSGSAVAIRKIEQAYMYGVNGTSNVRARRVRFISLQDVRLYYPIATANELNPQLISLDPAEIAAYIKGTKMYSLGLSSASGLYFWLDVVKWMPDYTGSNTDFFLDYHSDWLIAKTCDFLNIYLKEDQRVAISQAKLDEAWRSVCAFDEEFARSDNLDEAE